MKSDELHAQMVSDVAKNMWAGRMKITEPSDPDLSLKPHRCHEDVGSRAPRGKTLLRVAPSATE